MTDNAFTYMYVGPAYNLSTILTIDDWGVIRLIGTYQLPDFRNQISQELTIKTFESKATFVYPVSEISINFVTSFPEVNNLRNWQYFTSFGQLDILNLDNPGIKVSYSYSALTIKNSQILDFNGDFFPTTIFPNITFPPRCLEPRLYLDFKPPYVLVLDPFWPIATVYEQGRYKILQVGYGYNF